jgi:5-methylcytosine-specific restriction enzyme A
VRLVGSRSGLAASRRGLPSSPKRAGPVYRDPQWAPLVAELIKERGRKCEDCGKAGRVITDHIRELRDGGAPFDKRNLRLRCDKCHGAKTQIEKKKRVGLA